MASSSTSESELQLPLPLQPLPKSYHKHARVIEKMLANRNYQCDNAYEQAVTKGYIDGIGPRFGKMRVVFLNIDNGGGGGDCGEEEDHSNSNGGSIGVEEIDTLLETMQESKVQHVILIVASEITCVARGELVDSGLHWEMFLYEEVAFDRVDYMWMADHRLMSFEESIKVFSKLCGSAGRVSKNFDNPCYPGSCFCQRRMLTTGPISRYYDFQHGDMIHITVDSSTAGRVEKYRVVMNDTSLQ